MSVATQEVKDAVNTVLDSLESAADWLASIDGPPIGLIDRLGAVANDMETLKAEIWAVIGE